MSLLLLTSIGVGDIIGAVAKGRKYKSDGGDCKNPIVFCCHWRRHLYCEAVSLCLSSSETLGAQSTLYGSYLRRACRTGKAKSMRHGERQEAPRIAEWAPSARLLVISKFWGLQPFESTFGIVSPLVERFRQVHKMCLEFPLSCLRLGGCSGCKL